MDFIRYFLIAFTAIIFVVSMIMILSKSLFKDLNYYLNKSYSVRRTFRFVEIERSVDVFSFQSIRAFFVIVILSSSISLFYCYKYLGDSTLAVSISRDANHILFVQAIIDTFQLTLVFMLQTVIVISFLLFLSPQSFDHANKVLNCWVSTRKACKVLDKTLDIDETLLNYCFHIGFLGVSTAVYLYFNMLGCNIIKAFS